MKGPRGSSAPCLLNLTAFLRGRKESERLILSHKTPWGKELSVGGLGAALGWGPRALGSRQGGMPLHGERDPRGSDSPHTAPFILSKNQVKLQQGEFYAAQKAFTWLLYGHRTCTRRENTGDAGGSVPAQCHPHTLGSPVGQQHGGSQPARLCVSGQTGEEGEAPKGKQAWRGAGRRRGGGQVCLSGHSDGLAFTRALLCMA